MSIDNKNKIKYVLNNNPDVKIILKIAEILDGKETSKNSLPVELTADECTHILNMRLSHQLILNEVFQLTKMCYPLTDTSFCVKTFKKKKTIKSIRRVYKK